MKLSNETAINCAHIHQIYFKLQNRLQNYRMFQVIILKRTKEKFW